MCVSSQSGPCTVFVAPQGQLVDDCALFTCITEVLLAAQVCHRVGGSLAAPETISSVWRFPTAQRPHAFSAFFPLPVPGLERRSWGIGPRHALHGVPRPRQSGLLELGLRQSAANNYIQSGNQHDRLGEHRLESEWRNEGIRYCHRGHWTKWKLLHSKSSPFA